MFVEPFSGFVNDVCPGETLRQMLGENGIDFKGEKQSAGTKSLLNNARECACSGAQFHDHVCMLQSNAINHSRSQPAGTRHNGARQHRTSEKDRQKLRVLANRRRNGSRENRITAAAILMASEFQVIATGTSRIALS